MKKILIALVVFVSMFQMACTKDDVPETPIENKPVDVYVAGSKDGKACYWKNNKIVMLPSLDANKSSAEKIIVSNNNVYILGKSGESYVFWKNGKLTNLNDQFKNTLQEFERITLISDMEISGDDVYFVGFIQSGRTDKAELVYWKNGVKNILTTELNGAIHIFEIPEIKVVKDVLYVSGPQRAGERYYTNGYFINHVFYNLDIGGSDNTLAINNDEVYITGNQDSNGEVFYAGFYHNISTNKRTYPEYLSRSRIVNMVFDNNNMYISDGTKIYKNDTLIYTVSIASNNIFDLKVLNDNVYKIIASGINNTPKALQINDTVTLTAQEGENFTDLFIVQN